MMICFDLDNTLIRADSVHDKAFFYAFRKNGLKFDDKKLLESKYGKPGEVLVSELFPRLPKKMVKKVLDDHAYYVKRYQRKVKAVRGVKKTLKLLKSAGIKLCVTSNSRHRSIEAILEKSGIDKKIFDLIIGSNEVRHPKPAPDELKLAKKILKIRKAFMVGDTTYDVVAAKSAGFKSIIVTQHSTQSLDEIRRSRPDYIVQKITDLVPLISSMM